MGWVQNNHVQQHCKDTLTPTPTHTHTSRFTDAARHHCSATCTPSTHPRRKPGSTGISAHIHFQTHLEEIYKAVDQLLLWHRSILGLRVVGSERRHQSVAHSVRRRVALHGRHGLPRRLLRLVVGGRHVPVGGTRGTATVRRVGEATLRRRTTAHRRPGSQARRSAHRRAGRGRSSTGAARARRRLSHRREAWRTATQEVLEQAVRSFMRCEGWR
jgi:hypothetical protein